MVSEQFYLDSSPVGDNLLNGGSDLENCLDYRRQLNFSIVINNAQDKSAEIINILSQNTESPITFTKYNQLIETYLYLLMQSSFIGNLDQSSLTLHYRRKKFLFNDYELVPSFNYLEELLYGNQLVWGGSYGTLGYYNYLAEDKNHYQNPSQVIHRSIVYALNFTKGLVNDKAAKSLDRLENLLLSDSEAADVDIYNYSYEFIDYWNLTEAMDIADFLSLWLRSLIWDYLNNELGIRDNGDTNRNNALDTLEQIARAALKMGIDDINLTSNLGYHLLHQSISPVYFSLFENLYNIRKQTLFRKEDSSIDYAQNKMNDLVDVINLNSPSEILRSKSYQILESLFPLGGLNELLVILASALLNRLYIITHTSNNTFRGVEIYPYKKFIPDVTKLYGRCNKLAYMAGYLLKKTNIDYHQTLGTNLISLSNLYDEGELDEEKILDLRN